MEYEMMIPPFEQKKFTDMTRKEAQQYFEWYVSQADYRISVLKKFISDDYAAFSGTDVNERLDMKLDYSTASLIPLWIWYEKKIKIEDKDIEEYNNEVITYPNWMKPYISTAKISTETLKYGLDVSMYFAEVIIRNSNGKINWGFFTRPKKRNSVNEPTLLGFINNMDLNPRLIILNLTRHSSEETKSTRLLEIYNTWQDYIK